MQRYMGLLLDRRNRSGKGGGSLEGGLSYQRMKSESLPSYEGKRKGTQGLSHKGRITRVVLGYGKKLLRCR
jgi:hypothetical protein